MPGAIGRNRKSYFHARFQTGLHHLADAAIVESDPKATADFLGAAEYAFRHQLPDGDFSLVVPPQLQGRREASTADRVREEGGQRPLSSENGL
ncbi:MAG: hypothetical protein R3F08_14755 [Dokdonella sp.]|nr:hypothetical protein [Xanthomonadales bacterium]MCB1573858.1 hypothetical protein [Xanthomonadales bacterium]MCB1576438.1 hypothetical protein [Xanthomonadales bacterium]